MKEDCRSGLALNMHIHSQADVSFSAEDIVDDFATSGNRRMELLFKLCGLTVRSIVGERRFFYCGTEINILKFRYTVQIQLTTHTINSLEGLIRLVYYQVTLGTGLQQVKKLATPLVRYISLIFNEFRAASL